MKLMLCTLFLLLAINGHAMQPSVETDKTPVHIDFFFVSTNLSSQKAMVFLDAITKKNPWIILHKHMIDKDKVALQLFYQRLKKQHAIDFSTPSFFFCNSRWIGFDEANQSNHLLLQGLNYCKQAMAKEGRLNWVATCTLQNWSASYVANQTHSPQYFQRINRIASLLILVFVLLLFCARHCYRNRAASFDIKLRPMAILYMALIVLIVHLI